MDKMYREIIDVIKNKPADGHVDWTQLYQVAQATKNPNDSYAEIENAVRYTMTSNHQLLKWIICDIDGQLHYPIEANDNTKLARLLQNTTDLYMDAKVYAVRPTKKGHPLDKLAYACYELLQLNSTGDVKCTISRENKQAMKTLIEEISNINRNLPTAQQKSYTLKKELVYRPEDQMNTFNWCDNAIKYVTWADLATFLTQHWQYNNRISDMLINA